jgi:outer membrane lipoprotein carrier protein
MLIKHYRSWCLLIGLLGAILLIPAGFCAAGENDFEKLSRESAQIKTLKADFIQKKSMKILAKPLVSEGYFYFATPDSLRWEYVKPLKSAVISYKNSTRRYMYSEGKMVEDKTGGVQSMKIVLNEVAGWMSGRFDRNPSFKATISKKENTVVTLTPVEEKMKGMIERIEITLASKAGIVKSVKIYEGADSFTQINFNNVKINETIDAAVFREVK